MMCIPAASLIGGIMGFLFYVVIPSPGESFGERVAMGSLVSSAGVVIAALIASS